MHYKAQVFYCSYRNLLTLLSQMCCLFKDSAYLSEYGVFRCFGAGPPHSSGWGGGHIQVRQIPFPKDLADHKESEQYIF